MHTQKTIEKIKALVQRLNTEYADDPNITGIGWGMAERGGELRPELSLVFYVREKIADENRMKAQNTRPVPEEIEGIPTDVVVRGNIVPHQDMAGSRDDDLFDPLLGGVGSSNLEQRDRTFFWSSGGRGTLGILCRDSGNRAMALSNWHVWADDGAQNGDRIVQPSTPEAGGYAEGIAKTLLCGPVVGSLLEGRLPSGLAAGLYAGAAAAAALAALTDERDPFRRGQDATPDAETAITHSETLNAQLEYPEMTPWPGKPFSTAVIWDYLRNTNLGNMTTGAEEVQVNPQVLPGYAVAPDRSAYDKGETITIRAALWDYQPRPDDAYHVVANLVSEVDPDYHLRLLLHPTTCRRINLVPPYRSKELERIRPVRVEEGEMVCLTFSYYPAEYSFPPAYNFGPIAIAHYGNETLQTVDFIPATEPGLLIPNAGVMVQHAPADEIVLHLGHHTDQAIRVRAYNAFEQVVAEITVPEQHNTIHRLTLQGDMITHAHIDGGADQAELFKYCFHAVTTGSEVQLQSLLHSSIGGTGLTCIDFGHYSPNTVFPATHQFEEVTITDNREANLQIVGWPDNEPNSLYFASEGLTITHEAADRIVMRIGHYTGEPVTVQAFNAACELVDEVVKTSSNLVEVLELNGEGIVRVTITGGGYEGILVQYCYHAEDEETPSLNLMRCFQGSMDLPQDAPTGRWIVYLAVQNINHALDGTPPDQAATVIGAHVMGPTAQLLGCGFMMLGDHVFDIF